MLLSIIILIIGFVLLTRGSDAFVDGAVALARRWHVSEFLIALTVVAMGTSAPEFSIGVVSALHNSSGVAIGNIFGSNIANILLILGISSIIYPLAVRQNTLRYEIPFMIFITILLLVFGWTFGEITRVVAGILCMLFLLYTIYMYYMPSSPDEVQNQPVKKMSGFKIVLNITLGLAALIIGSNFTVDSATNIARYFNVSERIIGLTVIAVGTSLPELAIGIAAAVKHRVDLVIGNIIGTNIFNILFVLGIVGLIRPLPFEPEFMFDGAVGLLGAGVLWVCALYKSGLTRANGILFLLLYSAYLGYLIIM